MSFIVVSGVEAENTQIVVTHRFVLPLPRPGPPRTFIGSRTCSGPNSLTASTDPERYRPRPPTPYNNIPHRSTRLSSSSAARRAMGTPSRSRLRSRARQQAVKALPRHAGSGPSERRRVVRFRTRPESLGGTLRTGQADDTRPDHNHGFVGVPVAGVVPHQRPQPGER